MKKCANCGYENDDSFKFCMNCGTPIPEVAPVVAPVIEQQPVGQPIQQPIQQIQQQPIQQQYQQPVQEPIQQPIQQYQEPVQQMTFDEQSGKKNGFCIAGFVLALLSFITAGITSLFGLILSIVGLISASKKNQKGKGMAIAGIIISALFIIVACIFFICFAAGLSDFDYSYHYEFGDNDDEDDDDDDEDLDIKSLIIEEGSWVEENSGSFLVLENKKEFKYYKDYGVMDDYYYEGTYKIYVGEDAVDYVVNDLSEYYVEEDELEDLFDRNDKYSEDNFICLVLNNDCCIIDGEETEVDLDSTPYFGFYLDDGKEKVLDIANMNSGNYYWFIPESDYN